MVNKIYWLLGVSWPLVISHSSFTPAYAADWPQWRGPTRTGFAAPGPTLTKLPKEAKPVWKIAIGKGFSSPVIADNKLVYLDAQDDQEAAHLLDARTGKEVWQVKYALLFSDEWGPGPRSTPMIDGERIYAQSCNGEFRCLNRADGKTLWGASFEKDFGVKFLGSGSKEGTATRRGNNGCGVIDDDRIILPVGNPKGASLVCLNKQTGKVIWKSGNDEAAYSSFMVATLAGMKQVVAFTADALLGADFHTGEILWRAPLKTSAKRHAATPVVFGDNVVVNSHSIGLVCFTISKEDNGLRATQSWANKNLKINLSTPVLVNDHFYCQGPSKDYICADAKTGALKWSQSGFGRGQKDNSSTIVVGQNLLVLTEDGTLLLLEANPEKYTELGRLQVCGNTWCFPAYADGKLYVRDSQSLACIDLLAD